jgi:magnesium chelatase family protein
VGGGDIPRPGEVSLAHNGVLFLDELAEFPRNVLESLRQPLEDGTVCISRARARALFPARPMVVAAVNPCPCGYLGHPVRECRCTERASSAYRARLSGPLLDRLDVHVTLPPVGVEALCGTRPEESSTAIRERVLRARSIQHERFEHGEVRARLNALLDARDLSKVSRLGKRSQTHLSRAVERLGLSARGYSKVLRIARTIADLEASAVIQSAHVSEAIQSRLIDRPVFS